MWTVAVIFSFLLFYILNQKFKTPRLYPPGPPAIPIIGHLVHVCFKLRKYKFYHKVCQSWARQYGEVFGLKLGFINIVVVSGKNFIREVSAREVFEGRPTGFFYLLRSFGKKLGIVFSDGPTWSTTRRFVLKYLKGFGYNTRFMETYIGKECQALVKLRMADAGTPVAVNHMFHVAILNILWQLVAGKRYDLEDERLQTLCDLITRSFKAVNMSGGILNFIPFIRHILPDLSGYTELKYIHNSLHAFIKEIIKEHRENIDVKNPRDVIDAFLIEMMEDKDQTLTNEELQVVCLDLIEAGMETVTNTAVFMLLHIIRNDEVQKRLHAEIDEVIGRVRPPQLNDRIRMVYTEAVIQETLRISSVAAMGIPHMALDDARLGNYVIPKGTFILLSLHDLHNGEHWKDPEHFYPERFITKDGNIIQNEWLIPFGAGKRRCIGEGLARSELFLFLTHILQEFNLKIPDGDPTPSAEPIDGVSLSAKPFRIVFQPRTNFT